MSTSNFTSRKWLSLILLLLPAAIYAQEQRFAITLKDAEKRAIASSMLSQKIAAQLKMTEESLKAKTAGTNPQISLDGYFRYQTEVAEKELGPATIQFGQHNNYGIGPILTYKLFDGGADSKIIQSIRQAMESQHHQREVVILETLLQTRQAYALAQGSMEELLLVEENLSLVQLRQKDIRQRLKAGSGSKLDLFSIQREENQLKLKHAQVQLTLAEYIRQLAALIDEENLPDPLVPAGALRNDRPVGLTQVNTRIELDSLQESRKYLELESGSTLKISHPSLATLTAKIESFRLEAESKVRESRPQILAFAKSSYEYPNGPLDQAVWQNAVGLNFSIPLYDGGLRQSLSAQKTAEANATEVERSNLEKDLDTAWHKAQTNLHSIREQINIVINSADTAKKEAHLINQNHVLGVATYIEVARANNQVLELDTLRLRLRAQEIGILALLNYLSGNVRAQPKESTP